MGQDLIRHREQVMDRADKALDAAWPARTGDDYVRVMQWAVSELKSNAAAMHKQGVDPVERVASLALRIVGRVKVKPNVGYYLGEKSICVPQLRKHHAPLVEG